MNKALEMALIVQEETLLSHIYMNLGSAFLTNNELLKAEQNLNEAYKISKQIDNRNNLARTANHLGNLYNKKNRSKLAEKKFKEALLYEKEIRNTEIIKGSYAGLSISLAMQNKTNQAYYFLKMFQAANDSLNKLLYDEKVLELQQKFEAREKELQIKNLQTEKKQQEVILQKERSLKYIFSGLSMILILLAIFIVMFFVQKNKRVKKEQELKLIRSNIEGQEQERKRLSKELHDNAGSMLAGIKMQLENFSQNDKNENELPEISKSITDLHKNLRTIAHNLSTPSFIQANLYENLHAWIKQLCKKNKFKIDFTQHPENYNWSSVDLKIQIELYRIIQEALQNILKHANASHVEIQIIFDNDTINCTIEDDGTGFETETVKKGLGLSNMESRVMTINGKLKLDSHKNRGTIVNLFVPIGV